MSWYDPPEQATDEGWEILKSAIAYLEGQDSGDDRDEAISILEDAEQQIVNSYRCRFCGDFTPYKNSHCSKNCYRADIEGL
jgi:hypothetical protein